MPIRVLVSAIVAGIVAAPAAAAPTVPGEFEVRGARLAKQGGRVVAVHRTPQAVALDGCATVRARVRKRGRAVVIVSTHRCAGRTVRLGARVRGKGLRGVVRTAGKRRRFSARRLANGIRLKGSGPAIAAVRAVGTPDRYRPDEVLRSGSTSIARRELIVAIEPGATVKQINATLARAGGGITSAVAGSGTILVGIPDAGTLKALEAVRKRVARGPGVAAARLSPMQAEEALPPNVASPPSTAQRDALSHLLASGMAAAFNARAAADPQRVPLVVVADFFGGRRLDSQRFPHVDAAYVDAPAEFRVGPHREGGLRLAASEHGYHVTGIALADFANNGSPGALATGSHGIRGRLLALDVIAVSAQAAADAMINALKNASGNVVLNTSLGYEVPDAFRAAHDGLDWITKVRDAGLEARVLHATASGNESSPALDASRWNKAVLGRDFLDADDQPVVRDPLTNTLSVENVAETTDATGLGCLSPSSNTGGTISAPGEAVSSFGGTGTLVEKSGTSMATPLVAGLAAYMWSIAPDLTPAQLRTAMRLNADAAAGCATPPAPHLNAYEAVLSLDQATAPGRVEYPVRMALLDVTGDGRFTEADLDLFAPKVDPARLVASRDWSRFDLNGDGFTGGADAAPFDLDRTGSFRAGSTTLGDVSFSAAGRTLDERSLTDADIMCFYAYSLLYSVSTTGEDRRAAILGDLEGCAPKERRIVFASDRDGGSYDIFVMNPDGTGADNLTETPGNDLAPAWSPDGTKIAFESNRDGTLAVWTMNADGTDQRRLKPGLSGYQPAWSPDGKKLAFTSARDGTDDILVMNADGTGEAVNVTSSSGCCERYPSFSPDGTKLAFTSTRDGNDEIYVGNADGSGTPVNLTNNPFGGQNTGIDQDPQWSPDGRRLLFTSWRTTAQEYEIFTINDNGTGLFNVSQAAGFDANGSWSVDGQRIVFSSEREEGDPSLPEIYVANADGSNPKPLTDNDVQDIHPDW